jgi:predicted amidohydrolase
MKIALAQALSIPQDIKANLQTLHKFVIRAKESDTGAPLFWRSLPPRIRFLVL